MRAFNIIQVNEMIQKLVDSPVFDSFLLQEMNMEQDCSLFIEKAADQPYVQYDRVRPLLNAFLANERTPSNFKIVLQAPPAYQEKLLKNPLITAEPEAIKALILTFRYEHDKLTCLTGISFSTFITDKSPDHLWDQAIQKSLSQMKIEFEQL